MDFVNVPFSPWVLVSRDGLNGQLKDCIAVGLLLVEGGL